MTDLNNLWHIAGLGAIGSLCHATALSRSVKASAIVRKNSNTFCTHFTDLSGKTIELPKPVHLDEVEVIKQLVIPLKSYDILPFLTQVLPKLHEKAQVVLCHNGMGTIEPALALLPKTVNLYFCTSSHGVFKQGRQAHYAGAGESLWQLIRLGNPNVLTNSAIEALLPNAQKSNDLNLLLWQKLIINCAINPLTAIFKVKNGELATDRFQPQIKAIVNEAVTVAQANEIDISPVAMLKKVNQVITLTAANTSSMLQDRLNQRKTEIDFITGYLINQAQINDIKVPQNQTLFEQVRALS